MIHKIVCASYYGYYDTKRVLCVIDAMQKGFFRSNLIDMIYSAEKIVHALSGKLSLTHFLLELGTDFSFAFHEAQL